MPNELNDYVGVQIEEKCPNCKVHKMMTNKKGSVWCTDLNCNYYIRDGKRVPVNRERY